MAKKTEDLAKRLHTWAVEEMHFRPQERHINAKMPSAKDMQSVCRGQQMQDIWEFVMERVRSKETIKTVKGNLAMKHKAKCGTDEKQLERRANLLAQRQALREQLATEQAAANLAEQEVQRLSSEVATTEEKYQEVRSSVRTTHHKCGLLSAHAQQVEVDVAQYKEYAERMTAKTHLLRHASEEEQVFCRSAGTAGSTGGLETICCRSVRQTCELISTFLQNLLEGKYPDEDLRNSEKEKLWRKIEDDLAAHSVTDIVESLGLLAQTTALDLHDKTEKINIAQDGGQLKFKYADGQLTDTSSPSSDSLTESVQQLVNARQLSHLKKFVETEKHKNHTWRQQQRLSDVMDLMKDALSATFHGDRGAMDLAKRLFEVEVDIAATQVAFPELDNTIDRLIVEINEATKEKEALYAKYHKIQAFKELADSRQNLIRVLVKQNVSAQGKHDLLQEEICQYNSTIADHEGVTRSLTEQMKNSVNTEVEAFAELCLPFLAFSLLDSGLRLAVLDLSIHRLGIHIQPSTRTTQSTNQHAILQQVLTALEIPPYKAPECLLVKVVALQQEVADLESTLAAKKELVKEHVSEIENKASTDHFRDLCQRVRDQDQEQLGKLMPLLQQRLSRATQAFSDILRLKDTNQDWWEQPAQTAAEWVKVDGANLQQWRDKWTLAVTRIRQIQMKKVLSDIP